MDTDPQRDFRFPRRAWLGWDPAGGVSWCVVRETHDGGRTWHTVATARPASAFRAEAYMDPGNSIGVTLVCAACGQRRPYPRGLTNNIQQPPCKCGARQWVGDARVLPEFVFTAHDRRWMRSMRIAQS